MFVTYSVFITCRFATNSFPQIFCFIVDCFSCWMEWRVWGGCEWVVPGGLTVELSRWRVGGVRGWSEWRGWLFRLINWWEFGGCVFAVRDFIRGCRCGWCFMITGRDVSSYVSRCRGAICFVSWNFFAAVAARFPVGFVVIRVASGASGAFVVFTDRGAFFRFFVSSLALYGLPVPFSYVICRFKGGVWLLLPEHSLVKGFEAIDMYALGNIWIICYIYCFIRIHLNNSKWAFIFWSKFSTVTRFYYTDV